jgi:hypothetical protein
LKFTNIHLHFQGQSVSQACHLVLAAFLFGLFFFLEDRGEKFVCNGSGLPPDLHGITTQNIILLPFLVPVITITSMVAI